MKLILWIAYLIYFALGSSVVLFGALLPAIAKEYNLTTETMGLNFLFFSVANCLFVLLSGSIFKTTTWKKNLKIVLLITVASLLLLGLTNDLFFFRLSFVIFGGVTSLFYGLATMLIVSISSNQERASKLVFLNFFFSLGASISPFIAGYFADLKIWRWTYLLFSIPFFIVFILLFRKQTISVDFLKNSTTFNEPNKNTNKIVFFLGLLMIVLYTISESIINQWMVTWLKESMNLTLGKANHALSIFWISMLAGRFFSGHLSKKNTTKRLLLVSIFIGSCALISSIFINSYTFFLICLGIAGIGFSGIFALLTAMACEKSPMSYAKSALFVITTSGVAILLSTPIASIVKNFFGPIGPMLLAVFCMILLTIIITYLQINKNFK